MKTKIIVMISFGLLLFGCATQMVEQNAKDSCASQGKKPFIFDAKQNGVPVLFESASAMVLCVGPDDVTHLPASFGADAVSASNFVGAGIFSVAAASVAAKAGIKAGDIVTEFAGTPITNARQLSSYVDRVSPGTPVIVKIRRSGKEIAETAQF